MNLYRSYPQELWKIKQHGTNKITKYFTGTTSRVTLTKVKSYAHQRISK